MADIKSRLLLDNGNFNRNIKKSTNLTDGLKKGLSVVGGAARTAAVGLTAAAGALTFFVTRSVQTIDRLGKVSKTTGFTVKALQSFQFAAEQSGVTADNAALALRRFSRRLGEAGRGTGELLPALKKLGIETRKSNGQFKTAEEVLFEFADGIATARNESEALSLAFKAFDSEGAELVETLKGGASGLRAFFNEAESLGFILTASSIKGVEQFADEFNRLKKIVEGVVNAFTAGLAPTLQALVEILRGKIAQGLKDNNLSLQEFGKTLAEDFVQGVGKAIIFLEKLFNQLVEIGNATVKLIRLFGALFGVELFPSLAVEGQELTSIVDVFNEVLDSAGLLSKLPNLLTPAGRALMGSTNLISKSLTDLGESIDNVTGKDFFTPTTAGSDFVTRLLGDIEANKKAAQDQIDDITEIVVTGQNLIGETLLGKIFGVGPVQDFWDNWYAAGESALEKFKSIAGLLLGPELIDKIKEGFANSDIGDFTKTLADGLVKGVEMFEDSLADAVVNGKADFDDLAAHLKQVLAKAMIQKFITGPIMALFGLASGGPAKAGQPYIVGEEGPELFVPKNSGTVIPNHALGGMSGGPGMGMGGQQVTYNINAVDTQSFQQALARDPEFLFNVTQKGARSLPSRG